MRRRLAEGRSAADELNSPESKIHRPARADLVPAAALDQASIVEAYRRWAGVYDTVFGGISSKGRLRAVSLINRLPGPTCWKLVSGQDWPCRITIRTSVSRASTFEGNAAEGARADA